MVRSFAAFSSVSASLVGFSAFVAVRASWRDCGDFVAPLPSSSSSVAIPSAAEYSYSFPDPVKELAKRQPEEVQVLVKELWKDLIKTDEADLFVLKSLPDVCLGEIDCRGMLGKDVKPFVEAALSHKQGAETNWIARLSLAVAVMAALISLAGLFIRKA
jgi:hypothetical protein